MDIRKSDQAQLITWMDAPEVHEADFNRWYDREHMEERAAIPGFLWSRRYRSVNDRARRYLALYRTEGLEVFRSEAYQQAFQNQSDWSNLNLGRIENSQRRVMRVERLAGFGTGAAIALILLEEGAELDGTMDKLTSAVGTLDGVLGLHLMQPDIALSTQLPNQGLANSEMAPWAVIDATSTQAATSAMARALQATSRPANQGFVYQLLWDLNAADIPAL